MKACNRASKGAAEPCVGAAGRRMKGVSDLSERAGFFRPIVDSSSGGIARVYAAAEALFVQLTEELKKYQASAQEPVHLPVAQADDVLAWPSAVLPCCCRRTGWCWA